jgi:hypothetical protein
MGRTVLDREVAIRQLIGRCVAIAAIAVVASLAGEGVGRAQDAQESTVLTMDLGSDAQSPGNLASVLLSLRIPEGMAVGKAVGEITFPPKLLTFDEARRGLSAEGAGAQVTATTEPAGDTSIARVTITAKPGESLVSGVLSEIRFVVVEDVKEEITVPLKLKASVWNDKTPAAALTPVNTKDGEVQITATPPVIACFFYMH